MQDDYGDALLGLLLKGCLLEAYGLLSLLLDRSLQFADRVALAALFL